MSCPLPLCCVMGTCAYDILHWQRVFQEKNKRNLPCGVYDDKKWTSSNNREDITQEEVGINMKAVENAHKKLEKKSSVWSPFNGRKEQGPPVIQIEPQTESGDSSLDADTDEADLDLREWEWITKEENEEVCERLTKLTRSLSICIGRGNHRRCSKFYQTRHVDASNENSYYTNNNYQLDVQTLDFETVVLKNKEHEPDIPLFDCIFMAGLYHDHTANRQVPYTKDIFPDDFDLPSGIEELCFPDATHWVPLPDEKANIYTLVLTDSHGNRTFGYCRRIVAEGDVMCLPLALCILTRHSRSRGLFSQVLEELTRQIGRGENNMKIIYEHLSHQSFPQLGNYINIITGMKRCRSKSAEFQTISVSAPPPISQYPVFKFLTDSMQRRNSTFGRLLKFPNSVENDYVGINANDRWITKRIKRPIDFRFSGAPICSYFKTVEDLIYIYLSILSEKRLIVVSPRLSELSIFFDAIDSLLFPMTWQHTIIPALPISRKGFLDAPTPYLIGLLLNPNIEPNLRRTNSTPIRKKKKSFSERKKSLSDSFIRSLSHSPRLESSFEESDGISLRGAHISNDRPCSVPVISDSFDLTQENIEDIQFWTSFLKGQYDLEPDSLIMYLDKRSENTKQKISKVDNPKTVHHSEILKRPSDDNSLSLPLPVLEMIQKRFDLFVKSLLGLPYDLESDEVTRGKFVILCETFLHMYNTIFSPLEDYLQSKDIWKIANNGMKNNDDEYSLEHNFSVLHYIESSIPEEYKTFAKGLSETTMFDEYIRGKIFSLGINIGRNTTEGKIMLRRLCKCKSNQILHSFQDANLNESILTNESNSTPTSLMDPLKMKCPTHLIVHRTHTS